MNWSDYEMVWKRQKPPVGAAADVKDLRDTFETKRRKMTAVIRVRDYAEATAAGIVVVAFCFMWWQQGRAGWPIGLAILLTLRVGAVFVRERFRVRRSRLSAEATLLAKIEADLAELQHQRQLIGKLWRWYLGPVLAAMIIVGATITHSRPPWDISHDPIFVTGFWLFNAAAFWFAWKINQQALRKQIDPRIAELEKLRRDLLASL